MQTQVCLICGKDESSCIAPGPAEAVQKLLSLASSAALQALMGLRIAEGSSWIQQKAAGGLEADNLIFVILPAQRTELKCALLCVFAKAGSHRALPHPAHKGEHPGGLPSHIGSALLGDSHGARGTEPVPSLTEGQEASLLMEKMLDNVGTV